MIAFCTVLCGREEFTAMEGFGIAREAWLRGFLELPFGIPGHDTFRTLLSALDARQLAGALILWSEGVRAKLARPEIVAIDGESARRSIGWDKSNDGWIADDLLRPYVPPTIPAGTRVRIRWNGTWFPGQVLRSQLGLQLVRYDHYEGIDDEWVDTGRIRRN